MVEVQGRPFVEWVVRYLAACGFRAATISTGYLGEVIERHFAADPVAGFAVDCVREPRPLGTAGGFLAAANGSGRIPRAWLVLNGDSLIFADFGALAARLKQASASAALVARLVEDAGRFGSLAVGTDHLLDAFAEKSDDAGPGLINAGFYLLGHELMDRFPAREPISFEFDVFPEWIHRGVPIAVEVSDAPFLDIGTESTLALADDFVARNRERFL